ncbi:hypothetical protein AnigIFM56816_000191 [Aspergillus niger]|nr:hypothetical protein AnigIFM56816_000191 [Aspergillus niger]
MSVVVKDHAQYTIAWISALPVEVAAAVTMMDRTHAKLSQPISDHNVYTFGEISGHNIVLATLPSGSYGTVPAAVVVAQLRSTFPAIQYGVMVGIGGGVPSLENDIRLGDVVVNAPKLGTGGVIQYDFGKILPEQRMQPLGALNQPHPTLLQAASQLQAEEIAGSHCSIRQIVSKVLNTDLELQRRFSPPGPELDVLYEATYCHVSGEDTCGKCDRHRQIARLPRSCSGWPKIHYGTIASGNYVIKDGQTRDRLAQEHNVLCFEMEAAGVLNQLPTLVIRGISDYADSHKNNEWQGCAAINAAAYTRLLISKLPLPRSSAHVPCQPGFVVPFGRNTRFIGRQKEIEALKQMVLARGHIRKAAISGLGGVGKTQIALELAYRLQSEHIGYSVFWISAISMEAVDQAYLEISEQLGLADGRSGEVKQVVKNHLSQKVHGPWLMIVDNADDINMWLSPPSHLNAALPTGEHGFILFTTRNQQLATKLVGPHVIRVCEMEKDVATALLAQSLSRKDLIHDKESTVALIERLSGLPLAIMQAASYINENIISLPLYISLLEDRESETFELLSQDFEDEWRYQESINPILMTWLVSFTDIQKLNPLAADYLSFIACLALHDIPLELLPPGESLVRQHNALGILKAYSLVSEGSSEGCITIHRLVFLAVRKWLQHCGSFSEWSKKACDQLNWTFPSVTYENRRLWRKYLHHALFLLRGSPRSSIWDREELVWKIGQCLYHDGRYYEAENIFRKILERQKGMVGDSVGTATATWMTATLWHQGRLVEAERMEADILNHREWQQRLQDPEILGNIGNLALIYMDQGLLTQAEALGLLVMDKLREVLGKSHPKTCTAMSNLASIYRQQGRWRAAQELELGVLLERENTLGATHPDTITSMNNLATTYTNLGNWEYAEELQIRALKQAETILTPDHPELLSSIGNLASIYRHQRRWDEAETLELQVMDHFKSKLGLNSTKTLISMANLASTYHGQGQWNKALEKELSVLQGLQSLLGQTNPLTLRSMGNLASTYRHIGQLDSAAALEQKVMRSFQASLGPEHPDTLTSIGNLACTYRYQGRLDEAERLSTQVLEARGRVLGAEHPDTLGTMWQLARIWKSQGEDDKAFALLKVCVELHIRCLGEAHPDYSAIAAELEDWQLCRTGSRS